MSENKITLDALTVEEKKVEIEQERDEWRLCCSNFSASLIRYIGQMVCCASVLTFSFYRISQDKHGDNSVYFSLISGIVGYYNVLYYTILYYFKDISCLPQLQENHH